MINSPFLQPLLTLPTAPLPTLFPTLLPTFLPALLPTLLAILISMLANILSVLSDFVVLVLQHVALLRDHLDVIDRGGDHHRLARPWFANAALTVALQQRRHGPSQPLQFGVQALAVLALHFIVRDASRA
jgi:hypothetical protein